MGAFVGKDVVGGDADEVGLAGEQVRKRKSRRMTNINSLRVCSGRGPNMDLIPGEILFGVPVPAQRY